MEMKMTEKRNCWKSRLAKAALAGSLALMVGLFSPVIRTAQAGALYTTPFALPLQAVYIGEKEAATIAFPRLPLTSPNLAMPADFIITRIQTLVAPDMSMPADFILPAANMNNPGPAPSETVPADFAFVQTQAPLADPDTSLPAGFVLSVVDNPGPAPTETIPAGFATVQAQAALADPDMSTPAGFILSTVSDAGPAPSDGLPADFAGTQGAGSLVDPPSLDPQAEFGNAFGENNLATYQQLASGGGI